uniref:C-type lectin domain-containing protein n=1 Tax=Acrobeloides nanus TaxID=290746 RepID=A0A914DHT2_9BILA
MSFVLSIFSFFLIFHFSIGLCPVGSIEGIDPTVCYIFHGAPTDFTSAQAQCVQDGGNLASIPNAFINSFVSKTVMNLLADSNNPTWIGGTTSGSGQPANGYCITITPWMISSNWWTKECKTKLPYVCEVPALEDSCQACLSSTKSSVNQAFLLNHTSSYQAAWIGLRDYTSNFSLPYWKWTDGTKMSYTNWYPGEPVTYGVKDFGPCGSMVSSGSPYNNGNSYWDNGNGDCFSQRNFICKQKPVSSGCLL